MTSGEKNKHMNIFKEKQICVAKESFFLLIRRLRGRNLCMGVRTISRTITDTMNMKTGSKH